MVLFIVVSYTWNRQTQLVLHAASFPLQLQLWSLVNSDTSHGRLAAMQTGGAGAHVPPAPSRVQKIPPPQKKVDAY
jgi:hypothetical protein